MRKLNKWSAVIFAILLYANCATAQQSLNAGAVDAIDTNQDIVLSTSIGQVFYSENVANNISEIQGVQHALRFETLSIDTATKENLSISIYPNPATTHFKLRFSKWTENLSYAVSDINGKRLNGGKILSNDAAMPVQNLASGIYLVSITSPEGLIKTIKLIKK
jgi:hypothetical protein